MLADDAIVDQVQYPVLASPKLDGVRATFQQTGELLTRSLKLLPNRAAREKWEITQMLDGELIVGDPNSPTVFRDTMKVVMSHNADISALRFFAFDLVGIKAFKERLAGMQMLVASQKDMIPVPHVLINNEYELLDLEEKTLTNGYEGLMLRDPLGPYKFGRSTAREGYLLKVKRKRTGEAEIINYEEQMHNANEATTNALGNTERSSHQANKVPMGVLGSLLVRDLKTDVEFNVGTGFSADERADLWAHRLDLLGKLISYEYLDYGIKDKPRHPTFKGFRAKEDM
jgi:DNA ligase-1